MRTALFVTFLNDALFPATGQSTVKLLRRLGVELGFPTTQSCCGQMHYNTGYRTETAKLVRHFVEVFGAYDRIIVPSASCGGLPGRRPARGGRRDHAPGVRGDAVPHRHPGRGRNGCLFSAPRHPPPHLLSLRASQLGERPYRLLRAVLGIDFVELPAQEECCGFGGAFSIKNGAVFGAMNGGEGPGRAGDRGARPGGGGQTPA